MTLPNDDWRTDDTRHLFETILALQTLEEAAAFFRDLCTRRELEEMSSRWAIARLLEAGLPYREIAAATGTSTATITRINQWRQHGAGGYRTMLDRMSS